MVGEKNGSRTWWILQGGEMIRLIVHPADFPRDVPDFDGSHSLSISE